MALIPTQALVLPSILPTFQAAVGPDTVAAGNDNWLVVKNGAGAPITLTLVVPGNDEYGTAKPDVAISVVNATERYIPLRSLGLQDLTTGLITITYSSATSVTVGSFTVST